MPLTGIRGVATLGSYHVIQRRFKGEADMSVKPAFNAMKAVHLVHGMVAGKDKERAPAILADWKGYIAQNFALEDEQRAWMDSLDEGQSAVLTRVLQKILDSDGKERLVATMIADHTKPGGMYHELRTESLETRGQGVQANRGIVIAHCDADCGNWGWGPG